jgi:hypothetical protein
MLGALAFRRLDKAYNHLRRKLVALCNKWEIELEESHYFHSFAATHRRLELHASRLRNAIYPTGVSYLSSALGSYPSRFKSYRRGGRGHYRYQDRRSLSGWYTSNPIARVSVICLDR